MGRSRTVRALARCEPPKAFRFCVLYEPSRDASLQRLCASVYRTSARSFARCEPTKAFMPLCTVRAPRALRGASLQRLCASVCCKSLTRVVRCEPPKAFYRVRAPRALRGASLQRFSTVYERQELCAMRASKGFVPLCAVRASRAMCGASLQRLSTVCVLVLAPQDLLCARVPEPVHMYCLYELTRYLLFCTGTCMPECRGTEHSRGLVRLRVFSKHPQSRTI